MLETYLKKCDNVITMRQHARLRNKAEAEVKALKALKNRPILQSLLIDFATAMFVSGFIQNLRINGEYNNMKTYDVVLYSITEMLKQGEPESLHIDQLVETLIDGIFNTDGSSLMEDLVVARALFILANRNTYANVLEDSSAILADGRLAFPMFDIPNNEIKALSQLEAIVATLRVLPLKKYSSSIKDK